MASKKIELDEKAFPFYAPNGVPGWPGMTLYDYYLGQAVVAVFSDPELYDMNPRAAAEYADYLAMELLKVRAERMNDGKSL